MQNIDGWPFIIFCSCSALKIPAGLIYNGSDIGIISVRGVANAGHLHLPLEFGIIYQQDYRKLKDRSSYDNIFI
jgi:hypothetical protein